MSGAAVLALMTDVYGAEGGIAQYNRDLLDALSRSDDVATIQVEAYSRARRSLATLPPGTEFHASSNRVAFARRALRNARVDIVFCGHLHLAPVAATAAHRAGAALWMQAHGIEAWSRPGPLRRRAFERAQLVTAVSRYTRRRVATWANVDASRIRVLPNTVDAELFSPGHSMTPARAVVLSVGRLSSAERYKGHDRVIELLPRLIGRHPGLSYRIVGDGDDRPRLSDLARRVGVSDAVVFVGRQPRESLLAELRNATVFAMPSTGEGFGIAYLEALACGKPAIGLDQDGSIDALGDGELGVVASVDGLFEALDFALSQPADSAALASRTTARFGRDKFSAHVARMVRLLAPTSPR